MTRVIDLRLDAPLSAEEIADELLLCGLCAFARSLPGRTGGRLCEGMIDTASTISLSPIIDQGGT